MKFTLVRLSVGAFALTTAFGALLVFSQPVAALGQAEESGSAANATLHDLAGLLQFADNDEGDDDDDDRKRYSRKSSGGDDDDYDDDDEGCDDDEGDDNDGGCVNGGQMAPQGNVAPPNNGLFAPGAKPKAVIN